MPLSDESLLAGLASGDPDSAAAFVRRFQGRVFGVALAIVGNAETAEEVAQEAFVRAWRHADGYDRRKGRVATWLLAITRNHAIDMLRLKRPEPIDPDQLAAELSVAYMAPRFEEHERLRAAIAGLPHNQRRPLVLAAYLGRTAREISELDSVPLGTVKTRIRAALMRLRTDLEVQDER